MKIGITGSVASGKSTVSKLISSGRGPLFNADRIVKKLYNRNNFRKIVSKKFKFNLNPQFKKNLKDKIFKKKENLKKLEKLIHPIVRKEMFIFLKKNKNKKFLFLEIPLLIESKMQKYFDKTIFIKSNRKLRLKRYELKGGNVHLFNLLDKKQIRDTKKMRLCDHVIVNNKSFFVLKQKIFNIIRKYE